MADSTQVRSALNIFLQRKTGETVKNTLFNKMPTLGFLFALNEGGKKNADGIGRPASGNLSVGRINGASQPRRPRLFKEREYLPLIQISKPSKSDVKRMTDYDNDPSVGDWDSTGKPLGRFKQPRFKFARLKMPWKVPHSELRTALSSPTTEGQAARTVGGVMDFEVTTRRAVLCEILNNDLFGIDNTTGLAGAAGAPTDEDAVQWDRYHSIQNALKEDNTYGGVDRTVAANAFWQGNYETSAFTGSFADLIDYCDYDLGMLKLGLSVKLLAVGGELMKKAKREAKAESYQLHANGIPQMAEIGFTREVVAIHTGDRIVHIYYEPAMDTVGATNVAAIDPSTWSVAIHQDSNFKVSGPHDATETEGGDEADFGTIAVEPMVCCEVPKGNAWFTNVS